MEITASMVKELRERTGCGMMDCKKALQDANGDMEKALSCSGKEGLQPLLKRRGELLPKVWWMLTSILAEGSACWSR